MSSSAMDYEANNGDRYDDGGYERDQRSASPRRADSGRDSTRRRSASPNGNGPSERAPREDSAPKGDDDGAINPGSNLFVTGIAPNLSESAVSRLFEKYGEVEKCQIMRDPHTKESRGFGFVKMVTSDQADAAKEGLSGEVVEGRTFNIEKARRARPRTPTPGKYFGPPKREEPRGRFNDRYDERRRGGGHGGYGRDDPYRYRGYERRYEDRGYDRGYDRSYDRGYEDRGGGYERGYRGGYDRRDRGGDDAYSGSGGASGGGGGAGGGSRPDRYRDDRDRTYAPRGGAPDDRRAPGYERDRGYDRAPRDAAPPATGYSDSRAEGGRETYGGS